VPHRRSSKGRAMTAEADDTLAAGVVVGFVLGLVSLATFLRGIDDATSGFAAFIVIVPVVLAAPAAALSDPTQVRLHRRTLFLPIAGLFALTVVLAAGDAWEPALYALAATLVGGPIAVVVWVIRARRAARERWFRTR
jgi:peptidoglycan/LPS O-acetylase OafA/YrhL